MAPKRWLLSAKVAPCACSCAWPRAPLAEARRSCDVLCSSSGLLFRVHTPFRLIWNVFKRSSDKPSWTAILLEPIMFVVCYAFRDNANSMIVEVKLCFGTNNTHAHTKQGVWSFLGMPKPESWKTIQVDWEPAMKCIELWFGSCSIVFRNYAALRLKN